MKRLFPSLSKRPEVFFLILFLVMIFPSILLFLAAQAGNFLFMVLLLGLVILANIAAILK